jgi:hypothetical protein
LLKPIIEFFFGKHGQDLPIKGSIHNESSKPLCTSFEKCSLLQFLTDKPSAFYFPDRDAGPDLVFFLKNEDGFIPVFVQCKLRLEVSCVAALKTTNPTYFYCNRKTDSPLDGKHEIRMMILDHMNEFKYHLGILIAYPMKWKRKKVCKKTCFNSTIRYEQLFDGNNAFQDLLEENHRTILDNLKGPEYFCEFPV